MTFLLICSQEFKIIINLKEMGNSNKNPEKFNVV